MGGAGAPPRHRGGGPAAGRRHERTPARARTTPLRGRPARPRGRPPASVFKATAAQPRARPPGRCLRPLPTCLAACPAPDSLRSQGGMVAKSETADGGR